MHDSSVRSFLTVAGVVLFGIAAWAACPEGDLYPDCRIDCLDVAVLADNWLASPGNLADLTDGDGVNFGDYAKLMQNWGLTGQPGGSLYVKIVPRSAVDLGARWRLDGGPWRQSEEIIHDLTPGPHTVEYSEIAPWMTPPTETVVVVQDRVSGVEGRYRYPVVINEFMASNSSTKADPQGHYDDWIELYNRGDQPIDLGGMYLTDNTDIPTKWMVPVGNPGMTTVQPGGYLLIWADNDPEDYPSGLHATFELSAGSDDFALFDSNSAILLDYVRFPDQDPDISYGRYPDGNDTWRFFGTPSPQAQNTGAYIGQVADTKFSHNRGFYDTPFSVTLATDTDGASIYYTTDGSSPLDSATQTPTGTLYTAPVGIATTTVLRACAVKAGWKPTNVDAQTYIFLDDVISQPSNPPGFPTNWGHTGNGDYEMDPQVVSDPAYSATIKDDLKSAPTLSLAMPINSWFGASSDVTEGGIYSHPQWEDKYRQEAERAVSVEYFDPKTGQQFQINAGVRMAGGSSTNPWKMDKLSMRLKFTGRFGPGKLVFPIFGDQATDTFDTLVLDARMNNSWAYGGGVSVQGSRPYGPVSQRTIAQYTREQFASDIHNALSGYSPHGRWVHLYLNGLYWGIYLVHERPDEHFAEQYYGGESEDYDVLKHNSGLVLQGSNASYNQMFNIANAGLASDAQYQLIQQYLDVPSFIDYMITNYYICNTDWSHHNWYATHNAADPNGRWRYHCWDSEHSLEGLNGDRTGRNDSGAPTGLHVRLMQNADYKMLFADHVHKHLANGGPLSPQGAAELYQVRLDDVDRAVVGESARWGDNRIDKDGIRRTRNVDWIRERDWLLETYFPQRTDIVLQQFRDRGWYPNIAAPVFNINGSYQHGGHISPTDSLSMIGGATIYYTLDGSDPRVPPGPQITTTLVPENASKRVLVPTAPVSDNWRGGGAFDDSSWTAVTGKPGGVGYDENPDYHPYFSLDIESEMNNKMASCYIRAPFAIEGDPSEFDSLTLRIRYDDGFVVYLNGTEVGRRNFDAATPDWNDQADRSHSDSAAVLFEDIDLTDDIGQLRTDDNILAVHGFNRSTGSSDFLISFELVAGKSAGGGGGTSSGAKLYTGPFTLDKSARVKARAKSGSTWSALNEAVYGVGPVAESLRITEIMYNPRNTADPNDPNEEFIELKNIATEAINLNLVRFTRGIDFTFGDIELAAGEYVVVVKDRAAFEAAYPDYTGVIAGQYTGSLDNAGETIRLVDATGQTITEFRYKDTWRSLTDGQGFSLTIIDPSNDESYPADVDLAAHWKLDEQTGTVATDSAGSNDGLVHGAAGWTAGKINGALSFDGTTTYVSVPGIPELAGNSLTAQAWIRMGESFGTWNPILIQHSPDTNGYYFYVFRGKPAVYLVTGDSWALAESPDVIARNEWYHIAMTNDGSNLRLYVDGQIKAATSSTGLTGADYDAYIGYDYASGAYYAGLIDDVRIYKRALGESHFRSATEPTSRWNDKDSWRASAYSGGSPGWDDSGIVPEPGAVVVNEVLAHSHGAASDWIELYNTTDSPVDIGGWFLSDSDFNLKKYRIKPGTQIDAYGYLVLREDANFGQFSPDPGRITGFALSENGDQVYLSSAESGVLTGYRQVETFGPSQTGISLGRYFKRSTGNYNFVPMAAQTYAQPNSYPRVGPIVINEIMYNPDWPAGGSYVNDRYEYIELHNITASPVKLYRDDKALPWRFTEGIDFTFPSEPAAVTIPAGGFIIVARDPNAFGWRYPGVASDKIFGPYDGQLTNDGERIELSMPGDVDKFGRRHYIMIDRVVYSDGSHPENVPGGVDLWPGDADGRGKSLARLEPAAYGNDPNNWTAADPSPGQ